MRIFWFFSRNVKFSYKPDLSTATLIKLSVSVYRVSTIFRLKMPHLAFVSDFIYPSGLLPVVYQSAQRITFLLQKLI